MKTIVLDDVIDGIELQSDDVTAYLDCETGEVVAIGTDIADLSGRDDTDAWPECERELVVIYREIEQGSKRYVPLPSTRDVNEWDIMSRYCDTVRNAAVQKRLLEAIQGRGAFRRFKAEADRSGVLDKWFEFKRDALRELAVEWCTENDLAY